MDFLDPKFPYHVVISVVIIGLGEVLFQYLYLRTKREKDAHNERAIYHRKLEHDSLVVEREKLKEELKFVETIRDLKKEDDALSEQLDKDSIELNDFMFDKKLKQLSKELTELQDKAQELEAINKEIYLEGKKNLDGTSGPNEINGIDLSTEDLAIKIKNLETENQKLETQINSHKVKTS